jgi:glycosyltransferase involved in cell wall biosynthesis
VIGRLRHAVDWRVRGIVSRLETLLGETAALRERVDALAAEVAEIRAATRAVVSEEAANRRRLHAARASAEHELAWSDPDPLVTVAIPTRDRPELLAGRSIPSALAQTHRNLEVVVVGDAAGEHVAAAALSSGDPRVRYASTTHQVVQPDRDRQWLVGSTLARNEAHRLARGRWIVDLDDDDALRPDAVESLLALARAERLEVAYGDLVMHLPDGAANRLGGFPPRYGEFHWQAAIWHAGLAFFARELVAADLGLPGDWYRMLRMLRAGVRIGRLDAVVCDFYPGRLWDASGGGDGLADPLDVRDPHRGVQRERDE